MVRRGNRKGQHLMMTSEAPHFGAFRPCESAVRCGARCFEGRNLVAAAKARIVPSNCTLPSRICLGISRTAIVPGVPRNPHSHVFPLVLAKEA